PVFTVTASGFATCFADAAHHFAGRLTGPGPVVAVGADEGGPTYRDKLLVTAGQALLAGHPSQTRLAVRLAATAPDGPVIRSFLPVLAVAAAAAGNRQARVSRLLTRCGRPR